MIRMVPFNRRESMENGRETLERVRDFLADRSCNPIGRVSGALFPFRVDVIDNESSYEIFAELPGFTKEQVTVSYDDDTDYLHIKAERPDPEIEVKYVYRERQTGKFERVFEIDDIDEEQVAVSYENGVLHVVLPKAGGKNQKVFDIQ